MVKKLLLLKQKLSNITWVFLKLLELWRKLVL